MRLCAVGPLHVASPLALGPAGWLGGLLLAAVLFVMVCVVCAVILALLNAVLPARTDAAQGAEPQVGADGPPAADP